MQRIWRIRLPACYCKLYLENSRQADERSYYQRNRRKFKMILRYYHTLKYLKPEQTFGRLFSHLKKRIFKTKLPQVPVGLTGNVSNRSAFLFHDLLNTPEEIGKGTFNFLNNKQEIGTPIVWDNPDLPLLWRFNLHYFNFAFLLKKSDFEKLCIEWIDNNPVGKGTGWHSYPLSLRLINWIKLNPADERIIKSIYSQATFLYRNMEFYFPGNHYLENAKSLFFAAKYFNGQGESGKWLRKAVKIFKKEIPVQVLEDGGYFERSPMYHSIMLHGFLDMYNICDNTDDFSLMLKTTIEKMLIFPERYYTPGWKYSSF